MAKMNVLGWKHSKGSFEGVDYDYVLLYTMGRMEQKENQRGSAGLEMRGEPHLVEKLRKIDFPRSGAVLLDLEVEKFATGKGASKDMVVSFEVVPVMSAAAPKV